MNASAAAWLLWTFSGQRALSHSMASEITFPTDQALLQLLRRLDDLGYDFVTPTPATHARVLARRREAQTLRDAFGWSLPFSADLLDPELLHLLREAEMVEGADGQLKSRLRVSRLHERLYLHSAYPTDDDTSVFFGPDSYRFADFLRHELSGSAARRVLEIGAGSGVGGVTTAIATQAQDIVLADINPLALRLAGINAAHAALAPMLVQTSGLDRVDGQFDVIVANPPYIAGDDSQTYRDGGGMHGAELSVEWAAAAVDRLAPGGRFLLYTGSAISDGRDQVHDTLRSIAARADLALAYREIDPDVFGEELEREAYAGVERIAAIGAVLARSN